ncbi:MAG TPA: hypothetical protein VMT62_18325 [Syntrophorhabdaceae bacterium]|nr:hypothetical protein [Syntrophorhabdaceae bacterium]
MIALSPKVRPAPLAPIAMESSSSISDRQYLIYTVKAVVGTFKTHNPSWLPLGSNVKITYNGKAVGLGESLWKTLSSISSEEIFADPISGYGILYGIMEETGKTGKETGILALAVRVEKKQITGIEMIVGHKPEGWEEGLDVAECLKAGKPALWKPQAMSQLMPPLNTVVEPARRSSRDDMVAIAHSYWEGLEMHDSSVVLADPKSDRYEQGVCTTRTPGMPDPAGCDRTPDKFPWIKVVRNRRYLLVDEERGIVVCHVFLDTPPGYYPPDAPTVERPPKSVLISELFKIYDGKIQQIIAILDMEPFGVLSGWEE